MLFVRCYLSGFLLCLALFVLVGCEDKENTPAPVEGIIFSPTADVQEAYPGSLITFQYKLNSPEPITSFRLLFKFPDSALYSSLPEYPDVAEQSQVFSGFQTFEFALPPSATAIYSEMKFKLQAKTSTKSYERIYTVKLLNTGLQVLRLYNPLAAGYYRTQAIDLQKGTIVPAAFPADSKDLLAFTNGATADDGSSYQVLRGWTSGNSTRFKAKTKAIFDAARSTYAAAYAAGAEQTGAATLGGSATMAVLNTATNYYLARVVRPSGVSYVGLFVRKLPLSTISGYASASGQQDLSNEYLEIQIKK